MEALASGPVGDEPLRRAYERRLRRIARLTNQFGPSRRSWRAPSFSSSPPVEQGVLLSSMAAFFDAIKFGTCDLRPSAGDVFYAYPLHALTALLRPDRTPEAKRRSVGDAYAKELDRFAASFFFRSREPNVKQVVLARPGARAVHPRYLTPGLTLEPLPTYYSLTGDAFRFLRTVVEKGWSRSALELAQWRESGPIEATIGSGIDEVVELCDLAAKLSFREIEGNAKGDEVRAMRERLLELFADPDVTRDARAMIPLGLTEDKAREHVAVFAGWDVHLLMAELKNIDGELPEGVALGTETHPMPLPIVQETTVPAGGALDWEAVRARCDVALRNAPATLRWAR